jgi:hypothetical protein
MKKLLFTAFTCIAFSGLALANTDVKTENFKEKTEKSESLEAKLNEEKTELSNADDDVWFCYKTSITEEVNPMDGSTTITETYHCTWY